MTNYTKFLYRLVECSQNSLTTRFAVLLVELPQVMRGTSHSRSRLLYTPSASWRAYSSAS
jgi:hypothetical protein